MSSSHVCPCCFLNRISSLRNTSGSSWELMNQETHGYRYRCEKDNNTPSLSTNPKVNAIRSTSKNSDEVLSEYSNLDQSSMSLVKFDSDMCVKAHNYMYPERLVNNSGNLQLSESTTFEESRPSSLTDDSKTDRPASVVVSRDKTEFLAEQIGYMLQEQRQFLRELEIPISDDGSFRLGKDQFIEVQVTHEGDSIKVNRKVTSKVKQHKKERKKLTRNGRFTDEAIYFASGDKDKTFNTSYIKDKKNSLDHGLSGGVLNCDDVKQFKRHKKIKDNLKEEPVKLSTKVEWENPLQTSVNFNQDHETDKKVSVKMIFCPDGKLKCSTSSMESCGEAKSIATTSSSYLTAVNSYDGGFREFSTNEGNVLYTIAGSSSNLYSNVTRSESRGLLERE